MLKIIQSPAKYIQGPNALQQIHHYIQPLAKHVLVLADDFVMGLVGDQLHQSFNQI